MARIQSTIRPAPGADGPFFVVTEVEGSVTNVTTGLGNTTQALNQCRDDHGAVIVAQSLTFKKSVLSTEADEA